MKLTVIVGTDLSSQDEHRRRVLGTPGALCERIDVAHDAGDALVEAVAAPGLFAAQRVVDAWNLEAISTPNLKRLAAVAADSSAVVVARAAKLSATQRRGLPRHTLLEANAPTARSFPAQLRARARERGVTLSAELAALIATRCAERPERGLGVVEQLAMVGLRQPTRRQVETLLGSTRPAPKPWTLSDLAEAGRVDEALALLDDFGADGLFGLIGFLRRQLVQLDLARSSDPGPLAARLSVTEPRAQALCRRALRIREADLRAALAALARADHGLRGGPLGPAAVDLAVLAYARCFTAVAVAR